MEGRVIDKERIIKVMDMIEKDMEDDAKNFDGQAFNGKTVATYFGNQGAAISAIAGAVKYLIKEFEKTNETK